LWTRWDAVRILMLWTWTQLPEPVRNQSPRCNSPAGTHSSRSGTQNGCPSVAVRISNSSPAWPSLLTLSSTAQGRPRLSVPTKSSPIAVASPGGPGEATGSLPRLSGHSISSISIPYSRRKLSTKRFRPYRTMPRAHQNFLSIRGNTSEINIGRNRASATSTLAQSFDSSGNTCSSSDSIACSSESRAVSSLV
jgi:hypothetical protein